VEEKITIKHYVRSDDTYVYDVVALVNMMAPRIRTRLTEDDVRGLIRRGVTVEIR
jgi:hypothetical protein